MSGYILCSGSCREPAWYRACSHCNYHYCFSCFASHADVRTPPLLPQAGSQIINRVTRTKPTLESFISKSSVATATRDLVSVVMRVDPSDSSFEAHGKAIRQVLSSSNKVVLLNGAWLSRKTFDEKRQAQLLNQLVDRARVLAKDISVLAVPAHLWTEKDDRRHFRLEREMRSGASMGDRLEALAKDFNLLESHVKAIEGPVTKPVGGELDEANRKLEEARAQLKQANSRVEEARRITADLESRGAGLQAETERLRDQLLESQARHDAALAELDQMRAQYSALREILQRKEHQIEKILEELSQQEPKRDPVTLDVTRPASFQRTQILVTLILGPLLAAVIWIPYLAAPVFAAIMIGRKGGDRYLKEDSRRITRWLSWLVGLVAYSLLVTDRFAEGRLTSGLKFDVQPTGSPSVVSSLFRLIYSIPSVLVLFVVGLVAYLTWMVAAVSILISRDYGNGLYGFHRLYLWWVARLATYHFSLGEQYLPFVVYHAPEAAIESSASS